MEESDIGLATFIIIAVIASAHIHIYKSAKANQFMRSLPFNPEKPGQK